MPVLESSKAWVCYRCARRLKLASGSSSKRDPTSATSSFHTSTRNRQQQAVEQPASERTPHLIKRLYPGDRLNPTEAPSKTLSRNPLRGTKQDDRVRPQGWSALLHNKKLGENASVLVLRDTEERRGGRRRAAVEDTEDATPPSPLNVEQMLRSLTTPKTNAEQSDINASIDAMKPDALAMEDPDRPATISKQSYEDVLGQLHDSFNQTQLARYITRSLAAKTTDPDPSQPRDRSISQWHLPLGKNAAKAQQVFHRGKKALADRIVREIWTLEIREEIQQIVGYLDMKLDTTRLAAVSRKVPDSIPSRLEGKHYVNVKVIVVKKSVRITGPKYRCLSAAKELEELTRAPFEATIDFSPLSRAQRARRKAKKPEMLPFDAILSKLADKLNCSISWTSAPSKQMGKLKTMLTIRGKDEATTDTFKRLLLANLELETRRKDRLLSLLTNDDGIVMMLPNMEHLRNRSMQADSVGRFTTPFRLAKGEYGAPKELPSWRMLSPVLMDDVLRQMLPYAVFGIARPEGFPSFTELEHVRPRDSHWGPRVQSRVSASFGQVLHPMEPGQIAKSLNCEWLLHDDDSGKPANETAGETDENPSLELQRPALFIPTVSGLPHALQQSLFDDVPTRTEHVIRVQLMPSPWTYEHHIVRAVPMLEVEMALRPRDRHIEMTSVSATLGTRTENIMLPNMGTDLSIARRDYLDFKNPSNEASIQRFVHDMISHYTTTGQVRVPLKLDMRVPTCTLVTDHLKKESVLRNAIRSGQEEIEVEYFSASTSHESVLSFPYEGHDLVYTSARDGETGHMSESVSLQSPSTFEEVEQISSRAGGSLSKTPPTEAQMKVNPEASGGTDVAIPRFLASVQSLLRRLTIGLGKTKRMEDELRSKRREEWKQQEQMKAASEARGLDDYGHDIDLEEGIQINQ